MDKRTRKREAATGTVICRSDGLTEHGYLSDISEFGCRLVGPGDVLGKGSTVTLTLPAGISMTGTVRWVDEDAIGVEFDGALHPAALRYVTQLIGQLPRDQGTFDHFGRRLPPLGGG